LKLQNKDLGHRIRSWTLGMVLFLVFAYWLGISQQLDKISRSPSEMWIQVKSVTYHIGDS